MCKVAAFFHGHGVPLRMASRVYNICNSDNTSSHLIPYLMGGYYSTFLSNSNALHMSLYFNVKHGRIIWINSRNHSQLESVQPDQIAQYIDCRTIRQG